MANAPMPGNNVFSADEEKAMRQANKPVNTLPQTPFERDYGKPLTLPGDTGDTVAVTTGAPQR